MIVFFGRRIRGPEAGYSHGLPARKHDEQGCLLLHRIFFRLQARQERVTSLLGGTGVSVGGV